MKARWTCSAVLAITLFTAAVGRAQEPIINIDGSAAGRTFEGLGALSAGASSRLLLDYPEPQRSEVLDFLFRPNFGASLHHLKVEIGGDVNSTDGTEPSHARTREEFDHPRPEYYQRGYEWWLMREAKRRNPHVLLDVLQWGAPAWIGGGNFWSQDNADFIAAFIHGAQRHHGLDIDFCGLWNERQHNTAWIKLLRKTLDAQGLARVKIIAADECDGGTMWNIGKEVLTDRKLAAAIYAIGAHYPHSESTPECVKTNKPLFASEDGPWRGDWSGACTLAKTFNRNYIACRMTKTVIWSLISSYYDILPLPNSGPMKALEPWSGHYEVQPAIWAIAHTTQFAQPGWKYLDSGCGMFKGQGSYVTLRSPNDRGDYSIIAETVDAHSPQSIVFRIGGRLASGPLHVWRTTEHRPFEQLADLALSGDTVRVTLEPGAIYSFTTTTGQHRGQTVVPPAAEFPLPYADDFKSCQPGKFAKYFSDQAGVFEVALHGDGRGKCLRQVVDKKGIEWQSMREPCTLLGSRTWRNYAVSVDARSEGRGSVSLFGRVSGVAGNADPLAGYRLTIAADGRWTLAAGTTVLAEGHAALDPQAWHKLKLTCAGQQITATLDGANLAAVVDFTYASGMTAIGSGWNCAEFGNFAVRPVAGRQITNLAQGKPARASSQWSDQYGAACAVDDDDNTRWNAAAGKAVGEWLEVDLGRRVRFNVVAVRQFDQRIAQYRIQVADGDGPWRDVASGDAKGQSNWTNRFASIEAAKLRLLVVSMRNPQKDTPSIYELQVFDTSARK